MANFRSPRPKSSFFALIILTLTGAGCEDRSRSANEILSAFQSGCTTKGRWTDSALKHSRSLVSIFESLKENDACKGVAAQLGSVQNLSRQIEGLLTEPSFAEYRTQEEQLQELTLALQSATDPALQAALQAQLISTHINLGLARGSYNSVEDRIKRDRIALSTKDLATYSSSLLQQTGTLSACLSQSPSAAVHIATNLLAIGGSFFSPIFGAATAILGQLINIGVEHARTFPIDQAIRKTYQAQMPTAISCGMEAMSELYCDANDAFELLDFQATSYPSPGNNPHPVWAGLDLLGRRLPILNRWLTKVKNGLPPTDSVEAGRQNSIWSKLNQVDNTHRQVLGRYSELKHLYDRSTGSPDVQTSILRQLVLQIPDYFVSNNPNIIYSGPFTDLSNSVYTWLCWITLGPSATCPPHENNDNPENYLNRNAMLSGLSPPAVLSHWMQAVGLVRARVDLEFFETITIDPKLLLAEAHEPTIQNLSPRDILEDSERFLIRMKEERLGSSPHRYQEIESTITMIRVVREILDRDHSSQTNLNDDTDALNRIREIFLAFHLSKGLQYFQGRMGEFVRWDLTDRLRNGDLPDQISEILWAAQTDIRTRIASSQAQLDYYAADLNESRRLSQSNLKIFRDFYVDEIAHAVRYLDQQAKDSREPATGPNRPNGQTLAQLCTLVLATGTDWPSKISWDICSKAVLYSIYPDPDQVMTVRVGQLRSEMEGQPLMRRMCAYHRFLRAGRLAEVLPPTPPGGSGLFLNGERPGSLPFLNLVFQ